MVKLLVTRALRYAPLNGNCANPCLRDSPDCFSDRIETRVPGCVRSGNDTGLVDLKFRFV